MRKVATYEGLEISIDWADSRVMNYPELCDICSGQQETEINIDTIINNKLQTVIRKKSSWSVLVVCQSSFSIGTNQTLSPKP